MKKIYLTLLNVLGFNKLLTKTSQSINSVLFAQMYFIFSLRLIKAIPLCYFIAKAACGDWLNGGEKVTLNV
jgi:hypothetical protein